MKTILKPILLGSLLLSTSALAQEASVRRGAARPRTETATQGALPELSQRARSQSLDLTPEMEGATWTRTIYRRVDLERDQNAVLYYPTRPSERSQNLFTQIFRLVNSGSLVAYEYLDGQEIFEPEYQIKFRDLLDRFRITYTEGRGQADSRYSVALPDIPSAEVKAYYVKETWFFNQNRSGYDVRIDAICPILYDLGDYGEVAMPLFWVPYEALRPYISASPVMLSSLNNVTQSTLDDFFRLGLYQGEIVKTHNLRGLALAQTVSSPDSLVLAQKRIESELKDFREHLFLPDSVMNGTATASRAEAASSSTTNSRDKRVRSVRTSSTSRGASASSASATPKAKAPKASSSATRSVRGRG